MFKQLFVFAILGAIVAFSNAQIQCYECADCGSLSEAELAVSTCDSPYYCWKTVVTSEVVSFQQFISSNLNKILNNSTVPVPKESRLGVLLNAMNSTAGFPTFDAALATSATEPPA